MDQPLVIVLIIAVVVIAILYLMRKRQSGAAPTQQPEPPRAQPAPSAPAAPAAPVAEPVVVVQAAAAGPIDDENAILKLRAITLSGTATTKDEAIREAGGLLIATGAVGESYVESMFERERSVSTYMGNLLAIPHGTNAEMAKIDSSAISVVRYPNVLEWNGNPVKFVIGIAAAHGQHLELLGRIAEVFLDEARVTLLEQATSAEEIWATLSTVND
ncbi:MAG: PTS sugar transporter subunit IIA [Micropruina sp.]|uniref:PTS sugar transporter subunit IIA n=1 Tax=Micropruina sp. TaxID=2737536 RepID=UPI0039E38533